MVALRYERPLGHRAPHNAGASLHQPVAGIRHDDRHIGAVGLLGANGEHRHRQLRLYRLLVRFLGLAVPSK